MEGLAHRPSTVTSVMRQAALSFYQVQADDRQSIASIYGAYVKGHRDFLLGGQQISISADT